MQQQSGKVDVVGVDVIGMDVGGANLKYAFTSGASHARYFPMWRRSNALADTVVEDLASRLSSCSNTHLAITMTGELADCFVDREQGVLHIVSHLVQAAERLGIDDLKFYGVDGAFHDSTKACRVIDTIAAANWHALARWVAVAICPDATLVDIGSTTTDIIPIAAGSVATDARTDFDRLSEGSLVYVGCRRTPICGLVDRLRVRHHDVPIMREHFATMDDVMLLLSLTPEQSEDCDSADGKPRTREHAANRLARMVGLDRRSVSITEAQNLALQVLDAAKRLVREGVQDVGLASTAVLSGHGSALVDFPSDVTVVALENRIGPELARSAPAFAVAELRRIELEGAANDGARDEMLRGH